MAHFCRIVRQTECSRQSMVAMLHARPFLPAHAWKRQQRRHASPDAQTFRPTGRMGDFVRWRRWGRRAAHERGRDAPQTEADSHRDRATQPRQELTTAPRPARRSPSVCKMLAGCRTRCLLGREVCPFGAANQTMTVCVSGRECVREPASHSRSVAIRASLTSSPSPAVRGRRSKSSTESAGP